MGPQFNYGDIGYNFLVGGDGNIYEGRGWETVGAHTSSYNRVSYGIGFIGDFRTKPPNDAQLQAGLTLFNKGKISKHIIEHYKIVAHCQVRNFESPGKEFYKIIKTWEHWFDIDSGQKC